MVNPERDEDETFQNTHNINIPSTHITYLPFGFK